jgi:hypothetical protein
VQLFQYTKDPIALLEGAHAQYPNGNDHASPTIPTQPVQPTQPTIPETPTTPTEPTTPEVPTIPTEPTIPEIPTQPAANQIALDFSKVDLKGKEFINKRDISIQKNFSDTVASTDPMSFTITIKNKATGENFHGSLTQPLLFIASNTNITLDPVSTVVIAQGQATVHITPKTTGSVYIAINLGTAKIGGISVAIK